MEPGEAVGNYIVEATLGEGGMASVYRVRHRALGSAHALKVLRPELARSAHLRARFLHEGQVLAQIHHPGLVRVTDVVDPPGVAGLVMDLLEGRDLERRLRDGPLPVDEAAGILLQALATVQTAHAAGVIHRDLKPANLFLVESEHPVGVRVLDFGIAKLRGQDQTREGGTMGTSPT
ncbi:MAG: serine/threonine-protein kinase [Myxococcota bacterium]